MLTERPRGRGCRLADSVKVCCLGVCFFLLHAAGCSGSWQEFEFGFHSRKKLPKLMQKAVFSDCGKLKLEQFCPCGMNSVWLSWGCGFCPHTPSLTAHPYKAQLHLA